METDEDEEQSQIKTDDLLEKVTLFLSQYLNDARKLKLQASMESQLTRDDSINTSQESDIQPKPRFLGNALAYFRGSKTK